MNDKLTMTVQNLWTQVSKMDCLCILRQSKTILWLSVVSISITIKVGTVPVSVIAEILGLEELHVKTRYTGVTKDDKTGKYTYYFKAGVDLYQ